MLSQLYNSISIFMNKQSEGIFLLRNEGKCFISYSRTIKFSVDDAGSRSGTVYRDVIWVDEISGISYNYLNKVIEHC